MLMSIEKEILTKINLNDIMDNVAAQSDVLKKRLRRVNNYDLNNFILK